jgi:hypothetical protein
VSAKTIDSAARKAREKVEPMEEARSSESVAYRTTGVRLGVDEAHESSRHRSRGEVRRKWK